MRLSRLEVGHERLLFDRDGREELLRRRSGRPLRELTLRRVRRMRSEVFERRTANGPRVRLELRRVAGTRRVAYDLRMSRVTVPRGPDVCFALPAATARSRAPVELESRLRLGDGRRAQRVVMRHRWRCSRDDNGNVGALRAERRVSRSLRPGLRASLEAPRSLQAGETATYRIRVANARPARRRLRASLWNLELDADWSIRATSNRPALRGGREWKVAELRRGRERAFRLPVRVPRAARGRLCTTVVASAPGARPQHLRSCARVEPPAP